MGLHLGSLSVRTLITAKGSLSTILSCKQLASSFDCTIWVGLKSFEVLSELLWTQNELKPRERQVLGASYLELELLHSHRYQASQHPAAYIFWAVQFYFQHVGGKRIIRVVELGISPLANACVLFFRGRDESCLATTMDSGAEKGKPCNLWPHLYWIFILNLIWCF